MLQYRLIDTYNEFAELAQAWNELVNATPLAHVFMRHEWFDTWITTRDTEPELCILTGWRDGQLVAIAPLQRLSQKFKGITVRLLKFLQSPISPRCNFIALEPNDIGNLFEELFSLPAWTMLVAENVETAQPVTDWYKNFLSTSGKCKFNVEAARQSPYLDVHGNWESYLKGLKRDRRTFINSECLNRLAKAENFHFERFDSSGDPKRVVALMLDISRRSWKQTEGSAIGQVDSQRRFYERYTEAALPHGWIDVRVLHLNGQPVGFDYYLRHNDNYSLIRTDFDMEFKYYHPGENLKIDLLKELFSRNRPAQIDMGGDTSLYKQKWANGTRSHETITVGNRTLSGNAFMLARYTLLPALKRSRK